MERMIRHERIHIPDRKSLSVEKHIFDTNHPTHWHSFFEIEIILSGQGKYVINDIEYDIAGPNVFLLTPTDFHYVTVTGMTELINISFHENMLSDRDLTALIFSTVRKAYVLDEKEYERIISTAQLLEYECSINGDCQRSLLQYVVKNLLRKNETLDMADLGTAKVSGIKKAIIFTELHFREQITQAQVAQEAGYTPAYFSKLFKKVTGESYTQTLTRYRLSYARTLLANGMSVAESCFNSGFGSLTNFLESFKKSYGISPSEYKHKYNIPQCFSRQKENALP